MLTLKHLRYFSALAQERHFGRAAERVHVSQPALSMQIRDLEERLGFALVERGREMTLTPAGRMIAERATRILSHVAEIEGMARRKTPGGRINLGLIPTVAPYLLPTLIPTLGHDIRVHEALTHILLEKLERGSLDAIVMASPAPRDLHSVSLFEDRFLLAGNTTSLQRFSTRVDDLRPAHIDTDHLLLLDEGHCLADQVHAICTPGRDMPRRDMSASSLTTVCGLVSRGMGLTFIPEIALRHETSAQPDMRTARFSAPQPSRTIRLTGRASAAAEDWFADLATGITAAAQKVIAMPPAAPPDDK